jgi:proteic killer suppression protein
MVNLGGGYLQITYANNKVKRYFTNYEKMQKTIPFEWVRAIKKHIDRLEAADTFGDFLLLNLGHPEQLEGYEMRYSLRVAPNVRLIIEPNATQDTVMICSEIEIEGVCDYHGSKENWYIP